MRYSCKFAILLDHSLLHGDNYPLHKVITDASSRDSGRRFHDKHHYDCLLFRSKRKWNSASLETFYELTGTRNERQNGTLCSTFLGTCTVHETTKVRRTKSFSSATKFHSPLSVHSRKKAVMSKLCDATLVPAGQRKSRASVHTSLPVPYNKVV